MACRSRRNSCLIERERRVSQLVSQFPDVYVIEVGKYIKQRVKAPT